jgi:hypothetical protein
MNPDPTSLDRLHDIMAPPPVPWWPPAAGWYWLLGFLCVAVAIAIVRFIIHCQRNRYRREALAECDRFQSQLASAELRTKALAGIAEVLKRTALSAYPRERVASLTGPAWLAFLDRTARMQGFASGSGALLENSAYGCVAPAQLDEAQAQEAASLVRRWIAHHRTELAKEER